MWLSTFSLVLTRARISIRTIRTCRMAYLTQFSIPALLNPMINKMADNIAFHMFAWGRGSKWPMIGPWPCSYACAYIDLVFTGQSYDISISTSTRWTNLSIFLVLMLMLMSTQFSLAYTHVLGCLWCASENQALEIGAARRGAARLAVIEIALPQPFLCLNRSPIQSDFCGRPKAIYYGVSIALGYYLPLHPSNKRSVSPVFVSQR